MNPWDQEGTHPDEWAFGGGALNSNEQTWEHQHKNGTAGGAVPPSQKQDGEMLLLATKGEHGFAVLTLTLRF